MPHITPECKMKKNCCDEYVRVINVPIAVPGVSGCYLFRGHAAARVWVGGFCGGGKHPVMVWFGVFRLGTLDAMI